MIVLPIRRKKPRKHKPHLEQEHSPATSSPPPTANPQTLSTPEATPLSIVLGGSSVPPGQPLTYVVATQPAHGTLSGTPPYLTYTPDTGYTGSDQLTFRDVQGNLQSDPATVSIEVLHIDRPPVLSLPQLQSTDENVALSFTAAKANALAIADPDAEGAVERLGLSAQHGTLTIGEAPALKSSTGDKSASVTIEGTLSALNAALEGLIYVPTHNYDGQDTLVLEVDDFGHTGVQGPKVVTAKLAISVLTVTYDKAVADSYATRENETLAKDAAEGVLANDTDTDKPAVHALEAAVVSGPSHGTLTLRADGSFSYSPEANYHGPDSFEYKDNDGNTESNVVKVALTVEQVDRPPVNSVPLAQTTKENVQLTFSGLGANQVSVSDSDSEGEVEQVTLKVSHGTLEPGMVTGLSAHTGEGTGTLVLKGTIVGLNEALEGLVYSPAQDYHGADVLSVETDDLGHTGVGGPLTTSNMVGITVSTVVYDTANGDSYTAQENETLVVGAPGVLGNDKDSDSPALPLTAEVVGGPAHGQLKLEEDGSFTYEPDHNYSGSDSFTYRDNDGNSPSNVATVTLTVEKRVFDTATADAYATHENETLTVGVPGVLENDTETDSPPVHSLEAELVKTTEHGTLVLKEDGSFTYTPEANYHGPDSFEYKDNDGNTASNAVSVTITVEHVNEAPVLSAPAAAKVNEDTSGAKTSLVFSKADGDQVTMSDNDAEGGVETLELGVNHGTLAATGATGLTITGGGGASVKLEGTIAQIDEGLEGLTYTPTLGYSGSDTLSLQANDNGHTGVGGPLTTSASVNITVAHVNEAPVLSAPAAAKVHENTSGAKTTLVFSQVNGSQVTMSDKDAEGGSETLELSAIHGTLTSPGATGLTVTNNETASVTLEGTIAQIDEGLEGLTYTPTLGYSGSDTLSLKANDNGHTGVGGAKTAAAAVTITVEHVDEAPQVVVPGAQSVNGGAMLTFSKAGSSAITVSDADAEEGVERLTLNASHGTLQPGTTVGLSSHAGEGSGALTLEGTISALNTALEGSTYTASSSYTGGADTLTVEMDDLGHTGLEGPKSASSAIAITIRHTNEAPSLSAPLEAKVNENTSSAKTTLVFSKANSNQITMSDKDAEGGVELLELAVSHGTLSPHSATGLTVTGSGSSAVHLEGTLTAIGEGLEGLTYAPTENYNGSDALTLTADDNGHTGEGGAKTATTSVSITVAQPNPTPINPTFTGAIGNTEMSVGVPRGTTPDVEKSGSVLPSPPEGPEKSTLAVKAETITTEHGGSVSMKENGTFTYEPPVGLHSGTDKFSYEETDSLGGKATGTATIEFNGSRVWYVNNKGSGNGVSDSPFETVASAVSASTGGDVIFLENSSTAYGGGIKLEENETLDGQDRELNIAGEEVMPGSGAYPIVENAVAKTPVVTLSSGDTVSGVEVRSAQGNGIQGVRVSGTVTVSYDKIVGSEKRGIDLSAPSSGTQTVDITGNTIVDSHGFAIEMNSGTGAKVLGTVTSNTIGEPTVAKSGGGEGGIVVNVAGTSDVVTLKLAENRLSSIEGYGIWARESSTLEEPVGTTATLNLTMLRNTVEMKETSSGEAVQLESGIDSEDKATMCLHVEKNTIAAAGVKSVGAEENAAAIGFGAALKSTYELQGIHASMDGTEAAKFLESESENTLSAAEKAPAVFFEEPFAVSPATCPEP